MSKQLERKVALDRYSKPLWFLRSMPTHAAHYLTGIVIPPHENLWIRTVFSNYRQNEVVASRGTSKSFVHATLAAPLKALLHKGKKIVVLSASGFRGGKLLMEDTRRMVIGELGSQRLPAPWMKTDARSQKVIKSENDRWILEWNSGSYVMTVPTNDPENLRGIRANIIFVDERNFFPGDELEAAVRPMTTVGQNFLEAALAEDNQFYQVSTIDFTTRDWYPQVETARKIAKMQYEASKALKEGDHDRYDSLMRAEKNLLRTASISYTRVDFTDLLIPQQVEAIFDDGQVYEIDYPPPIGATREGILKWDEQDQMSVYYTYPVDKEGLTDPLINGTADEETWKAEQRNVYMSASGAVYPIDLLQRQAERPVYAKGQVPGRAEADEFYAPVMYKCGDPCVIGMDFAAESDHTAFVIIRLGPMSEREFNPDMPEDEQGRPCIGKTPWNHVIWAESWPRLTAQKAAAILHNLRERYNIINDPEVGGIALDQKGGGSSVRDELADPRPPMLESGIPDPSWKRPVKIYDPEDDKFGHYAALNDPVNHWSGLRLLNPTGPLNVDWTNSSRAQLQQKHLYLGFSPNNSDWARTLGLVTQTGAPDTGNAMFQAYRVGYDGIKKLKSQLVRIQAKVGDAANIRYVMPGDRTKEVGKKDLYSAFIYACHMANQYAAFAAREKVQTPMVAPVVFSVGDQGGRRQATHQSWRIRR